jgi:hypothetical protein
MTVEKPSEQQALLSATRKRCSSCGETKVITGFSYRTTEQRYESKCKLCRQTSRKCRNGNTEHVLGAVQQLRPQPQRAKLAPKRIIEPKVGMTNARVQAIDFGDLEKCSGRVLDHFEKHDAVQRFNEFIELLREGYSEIVGSHVHIRKD